MECMDSYKQKSLDTNFKTFTKISSNVPHKPKCKMQNFKHLKDNIRDFPGSPVVRTRRFHCRGPGSIPGQGTNIPQAKQSGQINK